MNIHFDTEFKFPETWSEGNKLLAIVEFWMMFDPTVRTKLANGSDMFSATDGIVGAVLSGLQQVDIEKLKAELHSDGSAGESFAKHSPPSQHDPRKDEP